MPTNLKSAWHLACLLAFGCTGTGRAEEERPLEFGKSIAPFFSSYCTKCHGAKKQKAGLSLHDRSPPWDDGADLEVWRMIAENVRFHDMPPEDEKQPPAVERERVLAWIRALLLESQQPGAVAAPNLLLPEFGNHLDHDALFNESAGPVLPAAPRLWRLRPEAYHSLLNRITERVRGVSRPFSGGGRSGFADYATVQFIDEPATDLLLRNAEVGRRQPGCAQALR